jgi:hypothetical protein
MTHYTVNAGAMRVKIVGAGLMHDEQKDHHAYGDPYCQSKDIDDGEHLALHHIAPGDLEIVPHHKKECKLLIDNQINATPYPYSNH